MWRSRSATPSSAIRHVQVKLFRSDGNTTDGKNFTHWAEAAYCCLFAIGFRVAGDVRFGGLCKHTTCSMPEPYLWGRLQILFFFFLSAAAAIRALNRFACLQASAQFIGCGGIQLPGVRWINTGAHKVGITAVPTSTHLGCMISASWHSKKCSMCALAGLVLALLALLLAALGSPATAGRAQRTLTATREAHEHQSLSKAVTVVVNFNMHNQVNLEVVQTLHSAYSAVFHRVVFTGQDRPEGLDRAISWSSCEFEWTFFSLCLAYTMAEYPEAREGGYIFIGDDSVRLMEPCLDHPGSVYAQQMGAWQQRARQHRQSAEGGAC